ISPPDFKNKFLKVSDGAHGVPEMIVLIPHPGPEGFPREKAKRVLHHMAIRVEKSAYDQLRSRLAGAGLEVRGGIHPVLKAVNTFYVDDPDGNELEVISPA